MIWRKEGIVGEEKEDVFRETERRKKKVSKRERAAPEMFGRGGKMATLCRQRGKSGLSIPKERKALCCRRGGGINRLARKTVIIGEGCATARECPPISARHLTRGKRGD